MDSALSYRLWIEAVLATLSTAVLLYFGNGLDPIWPLLWFAMLPVLLFSLRANAWATAATAIAAMMLGGLNLFGYFKAVGMPGLTWMAIYLVAGVVFAAAVLLFRALVRRGAVWSGLLAPAALWVTFEYLRSIGTVDGSAGSLAYSQLRFLPFLQLASITGPWGMTFVMLLFDAALALGLHLRVTSPRLALRVVGTGVAVVAAVLVFGTIRLAIPQARVAKVGLIASDDKANLNVSNPGPDTERLFRDYAREADKLVAQGAQVVVMPEKLGVALEGNAGTTDALLQALATRTKATVVAGVVHVNLPAKYNEARIYVPGLPVQRYDKEHMLPPFESNLTPGTSLVTLQRPQQKWGVAICKDMDFASPARLYGEAGVGLMLVPAWDFDVDAAWHGHIAVMRGVEDGFSIVRAAKRGFLTVSDNRGRIVGEVRSSSAPFATLLVDVPTQHSPTVYQYLGDWFAWIAMGLLVFGLISWRRR